MSEATIIERPCPDLGSPPFSAERLDKYMEEAGADVLLATSKHSIQYLLGGHRSTFFSNKEGLGESRYLPIFIYTQGMVEHTAYIGNQLEAHQHRIKPFWPSKASVKPVGTLDAIQEAIAHIKSLPVKPSRIAVEKSYLPYDAALALQSAFPDARLVDAFTPLEKLRSIKSHAEIEMLRSASQKVIDSMVATFDQVQAGMSKAEVADVLIAEETRRGLNYEYCFLTMGSDLNRAISGQRLARGDIISLDSGGNASGYIGDLVRMGTLGEPDQELVDILAEIEGVQQRAFRTIRPGVTGNEIYMAAEATLSAASIAPFSHFLAHGIGLVQHEMPRLTNRGPIAYQGTHTTVPIEESMCISVETTCLHPRRGFIKLEDTVAVTATGFEMLGDGARGWNLMGSG